MSLCGPETGHSLHTVAMCEDEETANFLVYLANAELDRHTDSGEFWDVDAKKFRSWKKSS